MVPLYVLARVEGSRSISDRTAKTCVCIGEALPKTYSEQLFTEQSNSQVVRTHLSNIPQSVKLS